jgi:hypothetical protein
MIPWNPAEAYALKSQARGLTFEPGKPKFRLQPMLLIPPHPIRIRVDSNILQA